MGFLIQYKRFFSVTFFEEEKNEPLNGFLLFATSETLNIFRNYNLVFRPHSSGFIVYYCASPLIPVTDRICITVGFTFSNQNLFKAYGLKKADQNDTTVYEPGLYFDNLAPNGSIIASQKALLVASGTGPNERVSAADTRHIYRQTFSLTHPTKEDTPKNYVLKHMYDSSIEQAVPVAEAEDIQTITTTINSVDMGENYISKPGPYLLQTTSPASSRNIYLSNELGRKSARGVIDIYWESIQNTVADGTGQQYHITFKPK